MTSITGPILSTIFCVLFAVAFLLTDSIHLIIPVLESRRSHASMLMKLFGPLMGIKNMDKFHGWLTTLMTGLIIAGIWNQNQAWSILATTMMATLQPYLILYAYYMKSCNLNNPFVPVFYSFVFGIFGLLWRQLDYGASYLNKYDIPMVALWHTFISLTVFMLVYRIGTNLPKFKASIELEKLKADYLRRGECTWPNAKEMPVFQENFEPYPILVETAEVEQENTELTKSKKVISLIFLSAALFMFGTSMSQTHRESIPDKIITVCTLGLTLPLVFIQLILITIFIRTPPKQEKEMFDNIEGARSYVSEDGEMA